MRRKKSENDWKVASICRSSWYQDTKLLRSYATLRNPRSWMDEGCTPQEGRWSGQEEDLLPLEWRLLSVECRYRCQELWKPLRVQAGEAAGVLFTILRR